MMYSMSVNLPGVGRGNVLTDVCLSVFVMAKVCALVSVCWTVDVVYRRRYVVSIHRQTNSKHCRWQLITVPRCMRRECGSRRQADMSGVWLRTCLCPHLHHLSVYHLCCCCPKPFESRLTHWFLSHQFSELCFLFLHHPTLLTKALIYVFVRSLHLRSAYVMCLIKNLLTYLLTHLFILFICSFICPDRSCYGDVLWMAWAISMKLTSDMIQFWRSRSQQVVEAQILWTPYLMSYLSNLGDTYRE